MPGQRAAERRLDAQVQPAVPRTERADQRRARDGGLHFTDPERFGLPGDGDAVRRAVGVSGDRELAALGIEG
ncbi:hypothetical protein ACQEVM_32740 [Streptomyces sp. CA-243310]|uniref:hypothetical protein n=1 Tax=Streptomyces sp. CA-243310 TaxID=3240056 RepID=UPI003D90A878